MFYEFPPDCVINNLTVSSSQTIAAILDFCKAIGTSSGDYELLDLQKRTVSELTRTVTDAKIFVQNLDCR